MNNLRPISLLDSIKRLVGRIITDRLQKAAEAQGVYSDLQFGFRAHHSTKMAIARLHATFNEARHRRGKLVVAYLDFANMYCTIPHALIRKIMMIQGLSSRDIALVQGLYDGTVSAVRPDWHVGLDRAALWSTPRRPGVVPHREPSGRRPYPLPASHPRGRLLPL